MGTIGLCKLQVLIPSRQLAIAAGVVIGVLLGSLCEVQAKAICEASFLATRNFRGAFISRTVTVESSIGPLTIGVVDPHYPGVAESLSEILIRSISDARQSNEKPGHLPDHLVDDVIRQYISPDKVKSLWAPFGYRFAMMTEAGEIVGTVHIAKDHDTILYLNRWVNNAKSSEYRGIKPHGYHQIMNLSVRHELRRTRLASLMMDTIIRDYRSFFNGKGLWMRADPPWHDKLAGLGFVHDPSMDSFLPAVVERTLNLSHAEYNAQYRCSCDHPHPGRPGALAFRTERMKSQKIQYFSFTRDFQSAAEPQELEDLRSELDSRSQRLRHQLLLSPRTYDIVIVGVGMSGLTIGHEMMRFAPHLKILFVEQRRSLSSYAEHGEFFNIWLPPNARAGGDPLPGMRIQPDRQNGEVSAGAMEKALLQNALQSNATIVTAARVSKISDTALIADQPKDRRKMMVQLDFGASVRASKIVFAIGQGERDLSLIDSSAMPFLSSDELSIKPARLHTFETLSRRAQHIRRLGRDPISEYNDMSVAVVGAGAAGATATRFLTRKGPERLYLTSERAMPRSLTWIGNPFSPHDLESNRDGIGRSLVGQVRQISYSKSQDRFQIRLETEGGNMQTLFFDLVVVNTGVKNTVRPVLESATGLSLTDIPIYRQGLSDSIEGKDVFIVGDAVMMPRQGFWDQLADAPALARSIVQQLESEGRRL